MIYCGECGSREVSVNVWVNANTGEHVCDGPVDDHFCQECNTETVATEDRREAAAARLAKRRERAA